MLSNLQKQTILSLLKSNKNYENKYWFSYKDYLDPADNFTAFSCENLEGKQAYITLIETLLKIDETAKIYVEVYGFEEDDEPFIYADTLIIFSKLSLSEIQKIFNEPEDIFPSDIQRMPDYSEQLFIVEENGNLNSVEILSDKDYSIYFCWWD